MDLWLRFLLSSGPALVTAAIAWPGFSPCAFAQHMQFRQYAQDRGLTNLGIQCLEQDKAGFVIVCTEDGGYRFDGRQFMPLGTQGSLPSQGLVYDVKLAPDGQTFVVFSNAVYVGRPTTPLTPAVPFVLAHSADGPIEVESPHLAVLLGRDLLLVERGHLSIVRAPPGQAPTLRPYFDAPALAAHPQLRRIMSVAVTADGIWLGCGKGEVCHVACQQARCGEVSVLGAAAGLPSEDWTAFLRDRSGTLWIRSLDHFAHEAPGSGRFVVEPVPGGAGRYNGHTDRLVLVEDPAGRILTQGAAGLLVRTGKAWGVLDRMQGLPEGEIVSIMFDQEGSLWLGIRDQGLFRGVGTGRWENWTRNEGLVDNVIWQIARFGRNPVWVASEGGVDALPQTVPAEQAMPHLPGSSYVVATTESGRVWWATVDGHVSRFDPKTRHIETVATLPSVTEMTISGDVLWIGTKNGLYRIQHPDSARVSAPEQVPDVGNWVHGIAGDRRGGVWVVTRSVLVHLDEDMNPHVLMNGSTGLDAASRAVAVGLDGDIWVGSGIAGLQKVHMSAGRIAGIERITMPVIGSNTILLLICDRRGWIWVGTDRGLDVWNGRRWHHLDEEDGLLSDDLDESAIFDDADGSMWFGTGHGVSHLLDPAPIFASPPLHPIVTSVQLGARTLTETTINWSHDPLIVRFGALDYRNEGSIRFRYRLAGVDRDWVETQENEARYPQLPPGHLVFSVQAIDPLKQRSSTPVSFTLDVRPPWWLTWPFLFLCGVTLSGLAATLWRLRVRYLLRRQHLLEELVALRTAEIELARAALFEQATRDSLTRLLNRPAIMQAFDLCVGTAAREASPLAVGLIDLDHFKSINDRFGHLGGDEVLREVARRLTQALHAGEKAGRYGGEELVVLIPGAVRSEERMQALRDAMTSQPIDVDGVSVAVTCSIGVAWHRPGDTRTTLLQRADERLYVAKNEGRDRVSCEA